MGECSRSREEQSLSPGHFNIKKSRRREGPAGGSEREAQCLCILT